jgi:hypothetical protein
MLPSIINFNVYIIIGIFKPCVAVLLRSSRELHLRYLLAIKIHKTRGSPSACALSVGSACALSVGGRKRKTSFGARQRGEGNSDGCTIFRLRAWLIVRKIGKEEESGFWEIYK